MKIFDVPLVVISTGLAWGMLLTATGLTLWDSFRRTPGLSRAVQFVAWLAGATLLFCALLMWGRGFVTYSPVSAAPDADATDLPALYLILITGLAAPMSIQPRQRSPRQTAVLFLPALTLAGVALFGVAIPGGFEPDSSVTPVGFLMAVCAGLGARALGEALWATVTGVWCNEWSTAATYALLTLVAGGTGLAGLWQRGTMYAAGRSAAQTGLAAAWLTWTAAWVAPHRRPRLRGALTVVAALLLILVVTK